MFTRPGYYGARSQVERSAALCSDADGMGWDGFIDRPLNRS